MQLIAAQERRIIRSGCLAYCCVAWISGMRPARLLCAPTSGVASHIRTVFPWLNAASMKPFAVYRVNVNRLSQRFRLRGRDRHKDAEVESGRTCKEVVTGRPSVLNRSER